MSESLPHIAIIGSGQLGSRYLQGLTKINQAIEISVVDPNPSSIKIAKDRYHEMPRNPLVQSVNYLQTINALLNDVDVAIIATTANVRREVIEDLIDKRAPKYMILEKVVFQDPNDFKPIKMMLYEKGVKTWVNFARRSYTFYQELKNNLGNNIINVKVRGQNWGLASNSIHMIDLIAFLSGEIEMSFNTENLERHIYPTKRNGFMEIKGTMIVHTKRGDFLELTDSVSSKVNEVEITINTSQESYQINETRKKVLRRRGFTELESNIQVPFQSDSSGNLIHEILDSGESDLTPYNECMKYHIDMLEAFNEHFMKITGKKYSKCPIT